MVRRARKFVPMMPKLGWQDHLLYGILEAVTGCGSMAVLLGFLELQEYYAFSYEKVAAVNSGIGNLNVLFMFMWLGLVGLLIACTHISRYPVFGNKKVRYGPPGYPRVYPLLMKNKPKHWVSQLEVEKKKRERKWIAIVLVSTFLFSLFMLGLSVCGREVLCYNGTVQVYNAWNRQKEDCKFSDIIQVTLETELTGGSRSSPDWYVQMKIYLQNGEIYSFYHTAFRGDTKQQMKTMIAMKECYGDLLAIDSSPNLQGVIEDFHLDTEEQTLLYQLFDAD